MNIFIFTNIRVQAIIETIKNTYEGTSILRTVTKSIELMLK